MSTVIIEDTATEMDRLFQRLHTFDFNNCTKFLQGWNRVKQAIPADSMEESLLKAQVYFYSREVEKVNLDAYKQWLQNNNKTTNKDILEKEKPAETMETHSTEDSNTDSISQCKHPANFIELVQMIEKGLKLPDTEEMNIEPLNIEPEPCNLQRPKKPWEIT